MYQARSFLAHRFARMLPVTEHPVYLLLQAEYSMIGTIVEKTDISCRKLKRLVLFSTTSSFIAMVNAKRKFERESRRLDRDSVFISNVYA